MIVTFEGPFPADKPEPRRRQLFRIRSDEVSFVREASDDELSAYDDAVALLCEFGQGDQLLLVSEGTHEDMLEALATLYREHDAIDGEDPDHFANALRVNRRLMNYLSARRTYLDFCHKRLARRYGKRSPERLAFKKATGAVYDEHFAYRFAECLRNHCQHHGFPIGHVQGMNRVNLATNVESKRLDVCFDLRELVAADPEYWENIRAELERMDPLLPIVRVVDEWPEHLRILRDGLVDLERPALTAAIANILDLLEDPGAAGKLLRVGRWLNRGGQLAFEYVDPPIWEIQQLSRRAAEGIVATDD